MSVFKAVGQGFGLTHRLWIALLAILWVNSSLSALATVLLPYEVFQPSFTVPIQRGGTEGQVVIQGPMPTVRVPPITSWEQWKAVAPPTLGLFFVSSLLALYFLGGILGSVSRLLRKEPFSPIGFFRWGLHWFFPILGWVINLGLLALVLSVGIGLPLVLGRMGAVSPEEAVGGIAFLGALLLVVFFLSLFLLLFSPVILVDKGKGIWASFGESLRFFFRHLLGVLGLFALVVCVALLARMVGIVLGGVANSLRAALGIEEFAKGWPVFFFGLLLGLPQAYLTVFFPCTLYAYYRAKTNP